MNRTLARILEIGVIQKTSYFDEVSLVLVEVMSGSEVFTHPTTNVQKTKRFFSQIKKVEKNSFLENQQIWYFSNGKLLFS